MVEHDLAKVGVAGSTPVSRSIPRYFSAFFSKFTFPFFNHPLRSTSAGTHIFKASVGACVQRLRFRPGRLEAVRLGFPGLTCGAKKAKPILLILFPIIMLTSLYAQSVELKPSYTIDSPVVTLRTFGIPDSDATVLELPKNRHLWRVPAFRIKERLKELGYDTAHPPSSMITFKKRLKKSYPALRKILRSKYEAHYPTLKIESISVEPTGSRAAEFTLKPECSVRLPDSALRKSSGTFVVRCGRKRDYFRYDIEGTILVYKANHQIKKDKIIDSKSAGAEYTPFDKFYAPPITDIGNGSYIARQNIAAGRILTEANVEPLPAVLKGSRVRCFYKEEALQIEFDAEALQNGRIGDTVSVKKSGGKILKGRVVDHNRVELQ